MYGGQGNAFSSALMNQALGMHPGVGVPLSYGGYVHPPPGGLNYKKGTSVAPYGIAPFTVPQLMMQHGQQQPQPDMMSAAFQMPIQQLQQAGGGGQQGGY
jgi:hypothetical protein